MRISLASLRWGCTSSTRTHSCFGGLPLPPPYSTRTRRRLLSTARTTAGRKASVERLGILILASTESPAVKLLVLSPTLDSICRSRASSAFCELAKLCLSDRNSLDCAMIRCLTSPARDFSATCRLRDCSCFSFVFISARKFSIRFTPVVYLDSVSQKCSTVSVGTAPAASVDVMEDMTPTWRSSSVSTDVISAIMSNMGTTAETFCRVSGISSTAADMRSKNDTKVSAVTPPAWVLGCSSSSATCMAQFEGRCSAVMRRRAACTRAGFPAISASASSLAMLALERVFLKAATSAVGLERFDFPRLIADEGRPFKNDDEVTMLLVTRYFVVASTLKSFAASASRIFCRDVVMPCLLSLDMTLDQTGRLRGGGVREVLNARVAVLPLEDSAAEYDVRRNGEPCPEYIVAWLHSVGTRQQSKPNSSEHSLLRESVTSGVGRQLEQLTPQ
mmetsp:Transcript_23747/g.34621  ORF Transcript_23747/g.34621 Transcript_23747/m.34621 type:complete len:447 (+) Transcript_23747:2663-4003(+)